MIITMKAKVIIGVIVALFCAKAHTQQCYQCVTMSSEEVELDSPSPVSCDDPFRIVNCTKPGTCVTGDYSMDYDLTGTGRVSVRLVLRNCVIEGAPTDGLVGGCLDDDALQTEVASQRGIIDPMLPKGAEYVSARGEVCYCSSNLCNGREPTVAPTTVSAGASVPGAGGQGEGGPGAGSPEEGGPEAGNPGGDGPAEGGPTTVASGPCKDDHNDAPMTKMTTGSIFMSLIISFIVNKF